jgi:isopropylmalate/homocitrate/citramalate synthase
MMSAEARMAAYENGIGMMSAVERRAASEKGYENGIGMMSAEERKAAGEKSAATKAATKAAKWTVEVDASIERMIDDGVSFAKIASKLGNGLSKNDIVNRWHRDLKKSSSIIKPAVQPGFPSRINWTDVMDATIVRMRTDGDTFSKIASLGNGLKQSDIENRWYNHLKDKLL